MALAKKYRLPKKDIDHLFKQGKTVKNSFFFIKFIKNDIEHLRTTVVVPIKIFKKATARNRFKRLIAETILTGHFLEKSYDIAVVAVVDIVGKQSKEIKRDLEQTMNKIFSQIR